MLAFQDFRGERAGDFRTFLTFALPVPIQKEEKKLTQTLIFIFFCGFMKALNAFIKHIKAPQGSENKNLS